MQSTKTFQKDLNRYIELQIENAKNLKAFSTKPKLISTESWQKILPEVNKACKSRLLNSDKRKLLKHQNLLEDLMVNEKCLKELVEDIKQIHAYEKQLVEFMHQVIAQNNEKSYQLFTALNTCQQKSNDNPNPFAFDSMSSQLV